MKTRTNQGKIKSLILITIGIFFFAGCQKTKLKKSEPDIHQESSHGLGAILDHKAFLKAPKINIESVREYLRQNAMIPKFELFKQSTLKTQTINGDPVPPSSVILMHPPAGDQGQTQTCVSWALGYCAKEVLDLTWKNSTADNGYRSGWFLYNLIYSTPTSGYSCHSTDNPPNGGNGLFSIDGINYTINYGIASVTAEPSYASCSPAPTSAEMTSAATDKPAAYYGAVTNVSTAKQLLAAGLPVYFAFAFYNDFQTSFYNNSTWKTLNSLAVPASGHAICFIGYDDSKNAFLAQNSWGTGGGDPNYPGCIWVDYGLATQLLNEGRNNNGAEAYALQPISSTPVNLFYNTMQYQIFSPNTCTGGKIPNPSQVVYEAPAGKFSSPVSVSAANMLAVNDVNTNGQSYANAHLNGCVVPPLPPQIFNFMTVGDFSGTSNYSLLVNGQNISGPLTMGPYKGNTISYQNPQVTATATVVIQITSGYMPQSAIFEGPYPSTGIVNSANKTITFSNVAIWSGQTCEIILQ